MKLTSDVLDRYKGGQAEIQSMELSHLCRGEIKDIYITSENALAISFSWCGRMNPPMSGLWVADSTPGRTVNLAAYVSSDIGEGRIALAAIDNDEMIVLFPAGGSALNPSQVKGLELPAG